MLRGSLLLFSLPSFSAVYGKCFSVTPRAWKRISDKNAEEGFTNDCRYLRLTIESGGCHGYSYKFIFEENSGFVPDEDIVVSETDVASKQISDADPPPRIVVDRHSVGKLLSAIVDFHSELKGSSFVVVGNELVDKSCACAMSFSMKKQKHKV
ncbi:hypothetical protein ERJ75_000762300 [Trypanosoma vivax]|uniref:Iron-sulfur assembly protein 2 n=1 Tax=Trypanosoma vivax (strain Y486) TaxID=1055687 RepID=G0TV88_TRYVY|nr:hypothetical protein TRVL_02623 [Trypanosoma vivax]KAH8613648.1 hypothetical protein ERJ75_000762300 [Trypanosoma vivax]CCC47854.1 conserved hypothetical protein [Trypanosoma vivax Y486]